MLANYGTTTDSLLGSCRRPCGDRLGGSCRLATIQCNGCPKSKFAQGPFRKGGRTELPLDTVGIHHLQGQMGTQGRHIHQGFAQPIHLAVLSSLYKRQRKVSRGSKSNKDHSSCFTFPLLARFRLVVLVVASRRFGLVDPSVSMAPTCRWGKMMHSSLGRVWSALAL